MQYQSLFFIPETYPYGHNNHIEGLLAVKPDEERSGDAVAEPVEEKDLAEAQETEDGCGKG